MSAKVDFKKEIEAYRARRGRFDLVEVPPLQYLMVDGHGDPNTSAEFTAAVEALYQIAYGLKFTSKRDLGRDYTVMPLEGLWRADDQASFTSSRDKSAWHWTLMIMQPEWIDHEMFTDAVEKASTKNPDVGGVRLETLDERLCAQTLHVGSYDDEAPVLARMHDEFIPAHGLQLTGTHHEIYFSDPRRGDPEKRRTLLRQPVRPIS
ncbi:GyrI-like domain-containing protein [Microbacterium sp. NPDC077644]|uniref:GyrI-like domain-containing protein n=1 Tax=Microbacterium sp. NPDC077644 TaxID=3155055 RepID=UPI00344CF7B5